MGSSVLSSLHGIIPVNVLYGQSVSYLGRLYIGPVDLNPYSRSLAKKKAEREGTRFDETMMRCLRHT